jgi:hypothetical protein
MSNRHHPRRHQHHVGWDHSQWEGARAPLPASARRPGVLPPVMNARCACAHEGKGHHKIETTFIKVTIIGVPTVHVYDSRFTREVTVHTLSARSAIATRAHVCAVALPITIPSINTGRCARAGTRAPSAVPTPAGKTPRPTCHCGMGGGRRKAGRDKCGDPIPACRRRRRGDVWDVLVITQSTTR